MTGDPINHETEGEWEIFIHDDQPVAEGKKYADDVRVEIFQAGTRVREFLYPAYRRWTLLAHWREGISR